MTTRRAAHAILVSIGVFTLGGSVARQARGQIPPSPSETAAYTGVHAAAAKGDLAALKALLAGGPKVELNAVDGHGRTALHVAAHRGDRDMVRALVAAGANVRALDSRRYDIITIAGVRDDEAMVMLAIELGGDPKAITSPYDGTALIAAAHLGHDGVVRALIAAGAPLDHVNNLGWTALIEAVILGNGGPRHVACVKALVEAGAKSIPDRQGTTPLGHAKSRGFSEMIRLITAAGGN